MCFAERCRSGLGNPSAGAGTPGVGGKEKANKVVRKGATIEFLRSEPVVGLPLVCQETYVQLDGQRIQIYLTCLLNDTGVQTLVFGSHRPYH